MADASAPLARRLNYAQVWEDWRLLRDGLELSPGDRVLSVASAGDNALALALEGAEVVGLDLSEPQIALCELKVACRHLSLDDARAVLGVDAHPDRSRLYRAVRPHLTEAARGYWDDQAALIASGIVHSGRFESYLGLFRRRVLPLLYRGRTVRGWLDQATLEDQARYYEERWDGRRWRGLFRVFFSRRVMAALGRSPEQFAHVEGEVGDVLLGRARRVFTEVPVEDNTYLQWMLTGAWHTPEAVPPYLTPEGHARLGEVAERVRWVRQPLEEHLPSVPEGTYAGYNLSNVFEYLDETLTERILTECVRAGRPGARLAYWNLFVSRQRPESLAGRLVPRRELAEALFARDRAFVYGAFRLEEIL